MFSTSRSQRIPPKARTGYSPPDVGSATCWVRLRTLYSERRISRTESGEGTPASNLRPQLVTSRSLEALVRKRMRELERAFQLAQSGTVRSIDDIRVRLRKEGYSASQLTGRTLIKQLRAIINSVQTERRVE
jgi:hypothetical protein